ncbi:hypothetical protein BurJ1DRAFT_3755 [Burkholderiales bacterium JOSHI_001]|nr:hypothetical protein BurJ1DRAFT_3755 [Burkholderiales bacterium JOSHI_001]
MALKFNEVAAARGLVWVQQGTRLFLKKPLAFSVLFVMWLFGSMLLMSLPVVGMVAGMAVLPLMSLSFMFASRSVLAGGPAHPAQVALALHAQAPGRRAIQVLCGLYGLGGALVMLVSNQVMGDSLSRLQAALASGQGAAVAQALSDPALFNGMGLFALLASLLSVPFWHAPALAHWGGQGVAQALFTSTLALWRAKGAFALYSLTWLLAYLAATTVFTFALVMLGAPQLAPLVGLPLGLAFSAAFYASLWNTFDDSFGPVAPDPPAPWEES